MRNEPLKSAKNFHAHDSEGGTDVCRSHREGLSNWGRWFYRGCSFDQCTSFTQKDFTEHPVKPVTIAIALIQTSLVFIFNHFTTLRQFGARFIQMAELIMGHGEDLSLIHISEPTR